ncbi:hypothetical protein STEG23_036209 [Scotinomys teguina]
MAPRPAVGCVATGRAEGSAEPGRWAIGETGVATSCAQERNVQTLGLLECQQSECGRTERVRLELSMAGPDRWTCGIHQASRGETEHSGLLSGGDLQPRGCRRETKAGVGKHEYALVFEYYALFSSFTKDVFGP